jgi:hypothetical protein
LHGSFGAGCLKRSADATIADVTASPPFVDHVLDDMPPPRKALIG